MKDVHEGNLVLLEEMSGNLGLVEIEAGAVDRKEEIQTELEGNREVEDQ